MENFESNINQATEISLRKISTIFDKENIKGKLKELEKLQ